MAIDLCNKSDLVRSYGLMSQGGQLHEALEGAIPLESLSPQQRDALEVQYQTTVTQADPRFVVGDPAAWASDFGYALDRVARRLDTRSRESLREATLTHSDPMMREQSLFEYVDRNEPDAFELLCEVIDKDANRHVRWDALWAMEKLGGINAIQGLRRFEQDADPEISEWSRLFLSELQTGDPSFDARECRSTPDRTFDETLYLLIHCDLYVRLDPNNQVWGKLSLSPQGLGRVYGEAHACPNVQTRERQLVIAKQISGLHADGSPHMDNYLFRGFTERTQAHRGNFYFESSVQRPFFMSGVADDASQGAARCTC